MSMAGALVGWKSRLTTLTIAFLLLLSLAMPLVTPFIPRASADNGVSNVPMVYGDPTDDPTTPPYELFTLDWNDKNKHIDPTFGVTCEFHFVQRTLDDQTVFNSIGLKNISQYVGKSDAEIKAAVQTVVAVNGNGFFYWFGSLDTTKRTGEIDINTGVSYIKQILAHINKISNIMVSSTPATDAGNRLGCGTLDSPRFTLIPVQFNGDDSIKLIGREINATCNTQCGAHGAANYHGNGLVLQFTKDGTNGLTADGQNTNGNLQHYDDVRNYVTHHIVVGGISKLLSPGLFGAAANASFQDVAHITITYNQGGTAYHEMYTDYRWDSTNIYFLSATDEPSREGETLDAQGQNPDIDPFSAGTDNHVPFIDAPVCGDPAFKSAGFNLTYNDNGNGTLTNAQIVQRINAGIDSVACTGLLFYDYTANGSIVTDPSGGNTSQPGLPSPEYLLPDRTNSEIWFYTDGKGLVTAFPGGDGHEALYIGNYDVNQGTQNPTYYDHADTSCAYLGRARAGDGNPLDKQTSKIFPINWTLRKTGTGCAVTFGDLHVYAITDAALYSGGTGAIDDSGSGTADSNQLVCDIFKISLSWLICPIAQAAISLAGSFDSAINDMLNISVDTYLNEKGACGDSNPGPCFYKAWNSVRILAMAVIVIASLVMIISQALGADVLDAYAIKKILPRLLVAVIAIAISWQLMKAAITASDVLGYGVRALIYKPFSVLGAAHIGAGTSDALAVLGGVAFIGLGAFGLLSFALTALLAVFVGFILLVFREMAVIFLVILSPMAIALYVLPNTRKGGKIWLDSTSGALAMFPIMSGFIAVGHVFAQVAGAVNNGGVIGQFIFIIAYFAPYFLIPTAFRLAGGLVATVGGVVNDRSKGAFDRLKNFRANQLKNNMEKMGEGRRFNQFAGNNAFSRTLNRGIGAFNTGTEGATAFGHAESKLGFLTNQGTRQQAFTQHRDMVAAKHAQSARAQATKENDLQHHALSFGSEAEARAGLATRFASTYNTGDAAVDARNMEDAISAARAAGGWSKARQVYAVRRLGATSTGFGDEAELQRAVFGVAGANRGQAASLLGELNAVAANGRHDLKIGYNAQMKLYDGMAASGGVVDDVAVDEAVSNAMLEIDGVTAARDKPQALRNMSQASRRVFQRREVTRDTSTDAAAVARARDELDKLTAGIDKIEQAAPYGSVNNMEIASTEVIQPTSGANTGTVVVNPQYTPNGNQPQYVYASPSGRRRIRMEASASQLKVNPVTDQPEVTYLTETYQPGDVRITSGIPRPDGTTYFPQVGETVIDANGNPALVRDPSTGKPIYAPNPATNPATERSRRNLDAYGAKPYDPYNPDAS